MEQNTRENLIMVVIVILVGLIALVMSSCNTQCVTVKDLATGAIEERCFTNSNIKLGDTLYLYPNRQIRQAYKVIH